jgi:hypothetical protein
MIPDNTRAGDPLGEAGPGPGDTYAIQAFSWDKATFPAAQDASAPIAIIGKLSAEIWTAEEGTEARVSWRITADAVLSARRRGKGHPDV